MITDAPLSELEQRLVTTFADAARRSIPDGDPPPLRLPDHATPARTSGRQLRPWLAPGIAAAAIAALTIGALTLTAELRRQPSTPSSGVTASTVITYRAARPLSASAMQHARDVIDSRLAHLGVVHPDARVLGSNEITAALPAGLDVDSVQLGAIGILEFRPSILQSIAVRSNHAPSPSATARPDGEAQVVNQWKQLGFAPPANANAYEALTAAQRSAVLELVNRWDCSNTKITPLDLPDSPIIACSQDGATKYLLGAAVVQPADIKAVVAQSPNNHPGQFGWSIEIGLTTAGKSRWTDYTASHNEAVHHADVANVVGYTIDGVVAEAATVSTTITDSTSISGAYNQATATTVAAILSSGPLPATFDLVNSQHH